MKTASFFGHRKVDDTAELRALIESTIIELIADHGVGIFYFGGFGNFDDMCFEIVSRLKEDYPYIHRVYCLEDPRFLRPGKMPQYLRQAGYDKYVNLTLHYDYWYTRIYYRNCEMVNQSNYVVYYIRNQDNSGAYKCYKYAKQNNKNIICL